MRKNLARLVIWTENELNARLAICLKSVSVDNLIYKWPKPPKDNKKQQNTVGFNERGNHAFKKSKDGDDDNYQYIYASMACMYVNDKISSRYFVDSLQLTNWILYSGATRHMKPQVSDFISGSLEDTYTYIGVADGNYVMAKKKGQIQSRMCDDNGDPFISTLHNIILAPDLCDGLFLIIMLMNSEYTYLFHKYFCTV